MLQHKIDHVMQTVFEHAIGVHWHLALGHEADTLRLSDVRHAPAPSVIYCASLQHSHRHSHAACRFVLHVLVRLPSLCQASRNAAAAPLCRHPRLKVMTMTGPKRHARSASRCATTQQTQLTT
jgi:hypothetical protein